MPLAERLRRYAALRERVWDTTASKYCAKFLTYLEQEQSRRRAGAQAAHGCSVAIMPASIAIMPMSSVVERPLRSPHRDNWACDPPSCRNGAATRHDLFGVIADRQKSDKGDQDIMQRSDRTHCGSTRHDAGVVRLHRPIRSGSARHRRRIAGRRHRRCDRRHCRRRTRRCDRRTDRRRGRCGRRGGHHAAAARRRHITPPPPAAWLLPAAARLLPTAAATERGRRQR